MGFIFSIAIDPNSLESTEDVGLSPSSQTWFSGIDIESIIFLQKWFCPPTFVTRFTIRPDCSSGFFAITIDPSFTNLLVSRYFIPLSAVQIWIISYSLFLQKPVGSFVLKSVPKMTNSVQANYVRSIFYCWFHWYTTWSLLNDFLFGNSARLNL